MRTNESCYSANRFAISERDFLPFLLCLLLAFFSIIIEDFKALEIVNISIFVLGIMMIRTKHRFLSFPMIFYVLCFLFHSAYFYFLLINQRYGNFFIFLTVPEGVIINAVKYTNIFMILYVAGVISDQSQKRIRLDRGRFELKSIASVGRFIVIVALIPRLFVDISYITAYLSSGYSSFSAVIKNNYIILAANLFYFGTILVIIGNKYHQRKAFGYFLFSLLIALTSMVSGKRGTTVSYLVAILIAYFVVVQSNSKIKLSKVALYLLLGYFGLVLLATFGDMRDTGTISISIFIKNFIKNFTYKLLFDQLGEFGYAAYTLAASIEYYSTAGFGKGLNYIISWVNVLPNVGGIISGVSNSQNFVMQLPSTYQYSLGGSLLGECFFNFGWMSLIIGFILGRFHSKIYNRFLFDISCNHISSRGLLFVIIIPPTILWIRSCFNEFPRVVVWYYLIFLLLYKFFGKRSCWNDKQYGI